MDSPTMQNHEYVAFANFLCDLILFLLQLITALPNWKRNLNVLSSYVHKLEKNNFVRS